MKKLMLLSFLMMAAIFVNAQRGGSSPEERAEKRVAHLTEALDLSTEQQAELKEVFIEQAENRKAGGKKMKDLSQEEKEAFKAERKATKAATDAKIANILTPDQQVAFENLAKEKKGDRVPRSNAKGKKGKKGNKGKKDKGTLEERTQKKTDRLGEQLGLDADQKTAVYDLFLQNAPTMNRKDFRDLSEEERAAVKAQGKEKRATMEAALAEILTTEQLATYQGLKKNRGKKGKKGKKNR